MLPQGTFGSVSSHFGPYLCVSVSELAVLLHSFVYYLFNLSGYYLVIASVHAELVHLLLSLS